jgi:hypothetical protein
MKIDHLKSGIDRRALVSGLAASSRPARVGTFPQPLFGEAEKNGWTVISMKNDWMRIFAFE